MQIRKFANQLTKMKSLLLTILLFASAVVVAQTSVADGNWIDGATWGGSSPGYTGLNNPVVDSYVISQSDLTFATVNARSITITDTLIVYGDVTFAPTKNNAEMIIGANNLVVIYGNLSMGKNSAGVSVGNGGVLVVTGTISATGTEGTSSISGAGKVYSNNPTGLNDGGISEGSVQTIDDLSGDGYDTVEEFVTGGGAGTLPVDLLYFNAEGHDRITLRWATASERNNQYFSIRRSEDGAHFYEIGRVNGNGTTNELIEYSYSDQFLLAPVEYYQLVQFDYDGQFEAFEIIRVETAVNTIQQEINVFPSVVTDGRLSIKSNHPFQLQELMVYHMNGSESINLIPESLQENPLTYLVDATRLTTGVYVLKMTTSEGTQKTSRIIVK